MTGSDKYLVAISADAQHGLGSILALAQNIIEASRQLTKDLHEAQSHVAETQPVSKLLKDTRNASAAAQKILCDQFVLLVKFANKKDSFIIDHLARAGAYPQKSEAERRELALAAAREVWAMAYFMAYNVVKVANQPANADVFNTLSKVTSDLAQEADETATHALHSDLPTTLKDIVKQCSTLHSAHDTLLSFCQGITSLFQGPRDLYIDDFVKVGDRAIGDQDRLVQDHDFAKRLIKDFNICVGELQIAMDDGKPRKAAHKDLSDSD